MNDLRANGADGQHVKIEYSRSGLPRRLPPASAGSTGGSVASPGGGPCSAMGPGDVGAGVGAGAVPGMPGGRGAGMGGVGHGSPTAGGGFSRVDEHGSPSAGGVGGVPLPQHLAALHLPPPHPLASSMAPMPPPMPPSPPSPHSMQHSMPPGMPPGMPPHDPITAAALMAQAAAVGGPGGWGMPPTPMWFGTIPTMLSHPTHGHGRPPPPHGAPAPMPGSSPPISPNSSGMSGAAAAAAAAAVSLGMHPMHLSPPPPGSGGMQQMPSPMMGHGHPPGMHAFPWPPMDPFAAAASKLYGMPPPPPPPMGQGHSHSHSGVHHGGHMGGGGTRVLDPDIRAILLGAAQKTLAALHSLSW